jgi:hypothetical protein
MVGITAAASAYYNSLGTASSKSDWLSSTETAIKNSQNQAGIMGALNSLSRSGGSGSIGSFLSSSKAFAGNFATIAQSTVSKYGSYYAQIANQNQQKAAKKKLLDALKALNKPKPPQNAKLDPTLFLGNGVTVDTQSNIMTLTNGTQIDITTGAKVVNSADIVQMGNGAYLNTATNIMTLSDGTEIDTVTGLKVNTTA